MSSLPEELYFDILTRLPVKSVLTCKCVCNSWFRLISNLSFIKVHLHLAEKKNPNFMLTTWHNKRKDHVISSISYHSLISLSPKTDLYRSRVELDYPFKYEPLRHVQLIGSCNGLVCLWLKSNEKEFFCLWNPATTEYKTLPNPPERQPIGAMTTFGYDSMADDYILVNVLRYDRIPLHVYTLRSNQWKGIQTDPYKFYTSRDAIFFNGTFHWLVQTDQNCSNTKMVISLDVINEKFVELQLPNEVLEKKDPILSVDVGVLEGCLSLLVPITGFGYEVWLMRDNGVRESWTKSYVLSPYSRIRKMWSFKNGKVLSMTHKDLILYDSGHAIYGKPKRWRKSTYNMEDYVESLVSLNSGNFVEKKEIQNRTKRFRRS